MAKRGRPLKIDGWKYTESDAVKTINELQDKMAHLAEERDNARRSSEDRFIMSQTLAKQLVEAEDRIKELLAEIRMYEHEHATLRHIIIDAMRGYNR